MKNDDIKKGLVEERKYLLPLNKIISNKKILTAICIALSVMVILLSNYIFNCIMSFFDIVNDIGNLKMYFSLKNMFVFNIKDYYWFYLILLVAVVIINIRFVFLVNVNIKDQNVGQKDAQRWTTIEEIKQQYNSMPDRGGEIEKGGLPVCQYEGRTYFDNSMVNNLILGMTRAGKGETFILLMIWLYFNSKNKASLIVNDPKEELYTMSYKEAKNKGYIPLVLNFDKPTQGIGFNPLDLVIQEWKKQNYSVAESLCLSIAETIYHPARLEGEAKFWASTAASVFSAMCIAQVIDCLSADEKQNAVNAIEWRKRQKAFDRLRSEAKKQKAIEDYAAMPDNEKLALPYIPSDKEFIPTHENEDKINLFSVAKLFMDLASVPVGNPNSGKTALDVFFEERPANDRAKMKFFSTQIAPDKTAASIYSSFFDALTVFTFEDVAKMTAKSTIDLYDIGFGETPYAIFLFTPDWDVSKHFLVNIFLDQVYFALSSRATETPRKRCSRDVMHILDEFGNIIPLANIQNKVSAGAGKGILYTFIIQSFAQLEQYKENAKTIKDNCSNQVYILSADGETRDEFSKAVGNETVTNVHRNGRYLSLDKTFMEIYEERPLITANALGNLTEGENVIIRYTKRRNLDNEKVRAYPIFNTGKTAFKYRYQYLEDIFPSDVLFSSLEILKQCRSNYDLIDITVDTNAMFAEKIKRQNAKEEGETYYEPYETAETRRLVKDLKQAEIIIKQLNLLTNGQKSCFSMNVGQAISEFEKARQLSQISKAEYEALIDLMIEKTPKQKVR